MPTNDCVVQYVDLTLSVERREPRLRADPLDISLKSGPFHFKSTHKFEKVLGVRLTRR